jgi:competence protein ComEC
VLSGAGPRGEWRFAALGGATAGLAAAPFAPDVEIGGATSGTIGLLLACGGALVVARPGSARGACTWVALVALLAAIAGLIGGGERVAGIDAGALEAPDGARTAIRGFVTAVPRRSEGNVSVRVATADGRLLIEAPEPVGELPVGREVRASGVVREPSPWEAAYLARYGIAEVLETREVELTGRRRGGLEALADDVRDRAEAALERGMPEREAALARGFVLGQDDRIDPETVDEFKRSGLAHLLAVSGQNVLLLALLALPLLAALNLSLRTRLLCVLSLIAIYVPVTGAGPSIQRAAVMGGAGIAAVLAGRPRSRWYALLLAAFVTLAANPRASGDVGWQLSFAAVVGILLWAEGIREWLMRRFGERRSRGLSWRRALAEGAAVTFAATVATAPLMAHHFDSFSLTALPANLLALPAVAPVMWLGMLAAIAGQVPVFPLEPVNAANSLLIAYIAGVADAMAKPEWALASLGLPLPAVPATYLAILCAGWLVGALAGRRSGLAPKPGGVLLVLAALACAAALLAAGARGLPGEAPGASPTGLEITALDVGQGDAILLEPADADPVLVDTGPPGAEIGAKLADEGVERLAAVVVTHDQVDHSGGLGEALGAVPVGSLAYARAGQDLVRAGRAAGARPAVVGQGDVLRSGRLRLEVLWPPRSRIDGPGTGDPNELSLVVLASWGGFSMLLAGDAEAESAPVSPGPIDALKVAHHGSEDGGLERLLERTVPRVAVVSVGENPYGHPTAQTMATLDQKEIAVFRTDRDGDVEIEVESDGWTAAPE